MLGLPASHCTALPSHTIDPQPVDVFYFAVVSGQQVIDFVTIERAMKQPAAI